MRRRKIKKELATTSSTFGKKQEKDLVYFIDDRVELMHQVFSLLKSKEIKSIAPDCVRNLSVDDLEELCLEELLGISSKRLLAILDGADPPSDTSSSDSDHSPQLETISLDSLCSEDGEISNNKSKRCKRRDTSNKRPRAARSAPTPAAPAPGATVLELLELQARARAIRAQLAAEHAERGAAEVVTADNDGDDDDDDDVVIKEEAPDVVELSTDDDAPAESRKKEATDATQIVTKNNDLIIIKPQSKNRRIKLNRTKPTTSNVKSLASTSNVTEPKVNEKNIQIINLEKPQKIKEKSKCKVILKDTNKEKDNSDHDEITLQLSDTEQMELEEFDRSKYNEKVSVSSDSDVGHTSIEILNDDSKQLENDVVVNEEIKISNEKINDVQVNKSQQNDNENIIQKLPQPCVEEVSSNSNNLGSKNSCVNIPTRNIIDSEKTLDKKNKKYDKLDSVIESEKEMRNEKDVEPDVNMVLVDKDNECENNINKDDQYKDNSLNKSQILSDGELSRRSSSEVEAFEVPQEVVCISDEEKSKKLKKNKSKKGKKSKQDKQSLKDFCKDGDENFYKDSEFITDKNLKLDTIEINDEPINIDNDPNYELYEISDDNSSCYEVEGVSVLSKEPTSEEIEAFSAKIDHEFERQEVVTDEEIRNHENGDKIFNNLESHCENLINVSWKDRYLSSTKVKKVLSTSNILNAIRKKNIELKKKIEETKGKIAEIPQKVVESETKVHSIEEGTIDHFNTLQGSSKYADPLTDTSETENKNSEIDNKDSELKSKTETGAKDDNRIDIEQERKASEALIRDARQLLKMYKKLLKQCGIVDPNKEKKKRSKKSKDIKKD